jgi:hypothetical protein
MAQARDRADRCAGDVPMRRIATSAAAIAALALAPVAAYAAASPDAAPTSVVTATIGEELGVSFDPRGSAIVPVGTVRYRVTRERRGDVEIITVVPQ